MLTHLAGRQGDAPQYGPGSCAIGRTALHQLDGFAAGIEEAVLGLLNGLVERLNGAKMPVDQIVQQPVQQEGHPVLGQVRGTIPALHNRVDVKGGVLADGDESMVGDKGGDLVSDQLARDLVERGRVADMNRWVW